MSAGLAVAVTEVDTGVFFAQTRGVNWTILVDGSSLTLVDTGYPRHAASLERSLAVVRERTGARHLEAILVTHAHSDHIGNLGYAASRHGGIVPTLASAEEVPHVRREVLHQVTLVDVLRHAYSPRVVRWAVDAVRDGGLEPVGHEHVTGHEMGVALDVPGHPVALPAPGHTPGHSVYHLPRQGLVITGDALVTAHPTVRAHRAQTLHPMFNHRQHLTEATAADLVSRHQSERFLPGHGPIGVVPATAPVDDLPDTYFSHPSTRRHVDPLHPLGRIR